MTPEEKIFRPSEEEPEAAEAASVFSAAPHGRSGLINLAGFDDESITNGPGAPRRGLRAGVSARLPGCHNPQTHAFGTGRDCTPRELFERIRRNPLVSGVTFSGGEPLSQPSGFAELAALLKEAGYEIAIYTGYRFEELLKMAQPGRPSAA